MEADFSGWATKSGLKCTDGRTIMSGAFRHQDQTKVPLVWQHGHSDPENVLGHAILENRDEGVYAYGFFNKSGKAAHAHGLLEHGDINQMSIWANQLVERAQKVLHGSIREVSLVLAGANPGALIENVTIRHSDGDDVLLDDEAIIYTGLELEHEDVNHADGEGDPDETTDDGTTVDDVYESMSDEQKKVVHYMLGVALEAAQSDLQQGNLGTADNQDQEGTPMTHNVFEKGDKKAESLLSESGPVLSHDDMRAIVADAAKVGSLKAAVQSYALAHGIDDIETLFPDAQTLGGPPEWIKRQTEWVASVLSGTRKSPFSRVKTMTADITMEEARAKGYVKGDLKKEEFFSVSKRVTTPQTVYKKQKLDRDDMVDITDFDVVAWLKGEMRLMLDEEIARAVLIGDGRDPGDEDKIREENIRPVATDHSMYTTVISVNMGDANSSINEVSDAIIANRSSLKGTGQPTMYTTEQYIAKWLLLRDGDGKRMYRSLSEVATELRVAAIVPVEVMEEDPSVVAILVNLSDYVLGADKGGQVAMFDDFDIDYNQYKYLIETRLSGALIRYKSAMVVRTTAAGDAAVVPTAPTFNGTDTVTIPTVAGVEYRNAEDDSVVSGTEIIAAGSSVTIYAKPTAGKYFTSTDDTSWTYRNRG
jgi:HK97 family phage prohead protease